jgi:tricarballylate dehydrogenase
MKVTFLFEATARDLLTDGNGAITGLTVRAQGQKRNLRAKAVILACGGFEGNPEMLAQYLGPRSINLRPVVRGGYYNKGEVLDIDGGLWTD